MQSCLMIMMAFVSTPGLYAPRLRRDNRVLERDRLESPAEETWFQHPFRVLSFYPHLDYYGAERQWWQGTFALDARIVEHTFDSVQ